MPPRSPQTSRKPISEAANHIAKQVVDAAFTVHSKLGPGLLESVYQACLMHELRKRQLNAKSQVELPVLYDNIRLDAGFRIDILVEQEVIIELKAVESIAPVHKAQLLTYLKLSGHRLGLLINFNVPLIKDGIQRLVW
jgi:GxxExxY protein